ncbi:hypothetical protein [Deinococcus misasensis]|uniref:hypothetical protein n=1 Tax=Deinococcus misasensis TaxID=392413 RepID=UPI00054D6AD5|nr:hypothetical protein [Deinococcus misasensis]
MKVLRIFGSFSPMKPFEDLCWRHAPIHETPFDPVLAGRLLHSDRSRPSSEATRQLLRHRKWVLMNVQRNPVWVKLWLLGLSALALTTLLGPPGNCSGGGC